MATIQIQIDDEIKNKADSLLGVYGLNTESAVAIFISTVIKTRGIPFAFEGVVNPLSTAQEEVRQRRLAFMGCMEGAVWMADDFDEPLEEMLEYMQ